MRRLTGHAAIDYAAVRGLVLSKYTDPTDEARDGLTVAEAREIARVDPSLVYLEIGARYAAISRGHAEADALAARAWRETDEARRMGESPLRSHESGDDASSTAVCRRVHQPVLLAAPGHFDRVAHGGFLLVSDSQTARRCSIAV